MNIKRLSLAGLALVGLFTIAAWNPGERNYDGANPFMTRGTVAMGSVGPIVFAPDGTLFLGDTYGGAVWAVDLEEDAGSNMALAVDNLDGRVASLLGASRDQVRIHDLAVSPVSHAVYITASRVDYDDNNNIKNTMRPGATPHLIRIDADGSLTEVDLSAVMFQQADIRDVRDQELDRRGNDRRAFSILEMSFVDGILSRMFAHSSMRRAASMMRPEALIATSVVCCCASNRSAGAGPSMNSNSALSQRNRS